MQGERSEFGKLISKVFRMEGVRPGTRNSRVGNKMFSLKKKCNGEKKNVVQKSLLRQSGFN